MTEETRKRRSPWKWVIIVGAAVLLLAATALAVLFPRTPYKFLRGSELVQIEIMDMAKLYGSMGAGAPPLPPGTPMSYTYKIYVSPLEVKELQKLMAQELTSADGWTDAQSMFGSSLGNEEMPEMAMFTKSGTGAALGTPTLTIMAYSTGGDTFVGAPDGWDTLANKGKSIVMINSETSFVDKVMDKIHRDKLPPMFPDPANPVP